MVSILAVFIALSWLPQLEAYRNTHLDASISTLQRRAGLENLVSSLLHTALHGLKNKTFVEQANSHCLGSDSPAMIIVSLVANLGPDYVDALRKNRAMEADKYNYKYCEYSHSLDDSRDAAWSKILAVRYLLDHQEAPVVWMDADAIFITTKPFESIVSQHLLTKDIVFTDDLPGQAPINTGVFVSKSTPWAKTFWQKTYDDFPEAINHFWWDQEAVVLYRERNREDFDEHTAIVPHRLMNNVGSFDGEFVAHRAGGHGSFVSKLLGLLGGSDKYSQLLERLKAIHP